MFLSILKIQVKGYQINIEIKFFNDSIELISLAIGKLGVRDSDWQS